MLFGNSTKYLIILIILLRVPITIFCQEYTYVHFDAKNGLAGSTVYMMAQDKDGYMWFATETGLSRFDGTRFKNFYTNDGLPDNEIISLFVDSKNRVWIVPFKNSICYYWKGKIHNQDNDSLLKKINISSEVVSINEDENGNVVIAERTIIYIINKFNNCQVLKPFVNTPFVISLAGAGLGKNGTFQCVAGIPDNRFFVNLNIATKTFSRDSIIHINNFESILYISPRIKILHNKNSLHLLYDDGKTSSFIPLKYGLINISEINDSLLSFNTTNEAYLFDINERKCIDTIFRNQEVNAVAKDPEENLWVSIPGNGVYYIVSGNSLNFYPKKGNTAVYSLEKIDSLIYAGSNDFTLWFLNLNQKKLRFKKIMHGPNRGRITALIKQDPNNLFIGTDYGLFKVNPKNLTIKDSSLYNSIKSIYRKSNNVILSSSTQGVFETNINDFFNKNYIWNYRTTCSIFQQGKYYVGTLNGLFTIDQNKNRIFLGDIYPIFKSRINAIEKSEDSTLWIATNGSGLIGFKNNKIIAVFDENKGLTSNICKNLFLTKNTIWVGTDKGLNKIIYQNNNSKISTFTYNDGLISDIINAIYVDGNDVFVGTPTGLTYFNETQISKKSICNLHITEITSLKNKFLTDTSGFNLIHSDNNIEFHFIGISFKSGGKITYLYRLLGIDTNWKSTTATTLNYTSLGSGNYTLQLKAINKFGLESKQLNISFSIAKSIWEKTWMRFFLAGISIVLIWIIIKFRIELIRRKLNEKSEIQTRINELEQMALKSQMNPHFIFNCLNSIQHYVINKDIIGANEFISNFSKLIRITLDNSTKLFIDLKDEISYITSYLELEQKRFEGKFIYKIITNNINIDDYIIPPMIIQPYIENAVRHGMRYRNDDKGKIIINFEKKESYLFCRISDNGIGRKLAQELKSKNAIEYQSKGMDLTARRIEMFNSTRSTKIIVNIHDSEDGNGNATGTEINIYFPINPEE